MRDRTKVLLGSAAGAIAIHLAFLACGTPTLSRDAGTDGGIADAMGDIADRETGTADAQGMPCNCAPELPPASFHFVPPAGMTVRSDYSRATVNASAALVAGAPGFNVGVVGLFFDSDGARQQQISCSLGAVLGTARTATCYLSLGDGTTLFTNSADGITATVTDTAIAIDAPSLTFTRQGPPTGDAGAATITLTNVQFRGFGRNLLAVPSQFIRR